MASIADLTWLRHDASVAWTYPNTSGAWSQVLPRDMTRFAIYLSSHGTIAITYGFGDAAPIQGALNLPGGATSLLIDEDRIGGAICAPLWIATASPITKLPIMSVSYNPDMHRIYERMRREFVSKFQPS